VEIIQVLVGKQKVYHYDRISLYMVLELGRPKTLDSASQFVPIIEKDLNIRGRTLYRVNNQEDAFGWIKCLDQIQANSLMLRDSRQRAYIINNKAQTPGFIKLEEIQADVSNGEYKVPVRTNNHVMDAHPYMPGEILIDYVHSGVGAVDAARTFVRGKKDYFRGLKKKGLDIVLHRSSYGRSLLVGAGIAAGFGAGSAAFYIMYRHKHKK
jgi:hypothetical protein